LGSLRKTNFAFNDINICTLLNGLVHFGQVETSEDFFKEMEEKDLISDYTIDFYSNCLSTKGHHEKAEFYKKKHKVF
jgi:pentatricopeptide repeat protein